MPNTTEAVLIPNRARQEIGDRSQPNHALERTRPPAKPGGWPLSLEPLGRLSAVSSTRCHFKQCCSESRGGSTDVEFSVAFEGGPARALPHVASSASGSRSASPLTALLFAHESQGS